MKTRQKSLMANGKRQIVNRSGFDKNFSVNCVVEINP